MLLGHINHHLVSQNLGLRQILDWEMYVHNIMDNKLWNDRFLPLLKKVGLRKLAINTTLMCKKYLGLSTGIILKEDISEDASELLLKMVLKSGNFGSKTAKKITIKSFFLTEYTI